MSVSNSARGVKGGRPAAARVKQAVTHDRLTLSAAYPSGGYFRFTIGLSGERLAWGGCDDRATARAEMAVFQAAAKRLPGETNGQRIDRLAAIARDSASIADLISKLS